MIAENLQADIKARDFIDIRLGIGTALQFDHNVFGDFTEIIAFCKANGVQLDDLYEEHDGRNIDLEPSEDSFAELIGQLATNFSEKRLEKVLEIAQKVWPERQDNSAIQNSISNDKKKNPTKYSIEREIEYDKDGNKIIAKRRVNTSHTSSASDGPRSYSNSFQSNVHKNASGSRILYAIIAAAAVLAAVIVLA